MPGHLAVKFYDWMAPSCILITSNHPDTIQIQIQLQIRPEPTMNYPLDNPFDLSQRSRISWCPGALVF